MLKTVFEKERIINSNVDKAIKLLSKHWYYDDAEDVCYNNKELNNFIWKSGACKICILFFNFVLKTTFSDFIEWFDDGTPNMIDYNNDDSSLLNTETEALIYRAAARVGLERFLQKQYNLIIKLFYKNLYQKQCKTI